MNKDLHNTDDVFYRAYQRFEDDPSPAVWEKINAGLDKKDADSYKRKLAGWKRISLLLLLLLTGFVLYESGIIKGSTVNSTKNSAAEETYNPAIPEEKNKPLRHIESLSGNLNDKTNLNNKEDNTDVTSTVNDEILKNETGIAVLKNVIPVSTKNAAGNKAATQRNNPPTGLPDFFVSTGKTAVAAAEINTTSNELVMHDKGLAAEKIYAVPPTEKISRQLPVLLSVANSPLTATATNDKSPAKVSLFKPYWFLSGYLSYDRANYRLDNDLPAAPTIKQREEQEPSFSAGLLITRQVKKQWGLQTGFMYSNTAIAISPQKMYAFQESAGSVAYKYVTSSGYAYVKPGFGSPPSVGDSLTTAKGKHTLQHISVPLIIKYTVTKNKISFTPGAGIAANFLTSAKVETEIEDPFNREIVSINKLKGIKSFYWSVVADAEVQYKINSKLSVSIRPSLRYAISPITKNSDVETFPYSVGLGIGIKCRF